MGDRRSVRQATLAALSLAFCQFVLDARLPEPDAVLFGRIRHNSVSDFTSAQTSQRTFSFQVTGEGRTVPVHGYIQVEDGSSYYVLKIPMDDGKAPRLPNSFSRGETITQVGVTNETDGIAGQVTISECLASERAEMREVALSLSTPMLPVAHLDTDADGMPDQWEALYAQPANGVSALNPSADDGASDNDGDGVSNYDEYLTGTDPQDPDSQFGVRDIAKAGAIVTVTFGPVLPGRRYTVHAAPQARAATWTAVTTLDVDEEADETAVQHDVGSADRQYYRVEVDWE